MTIRMHTYQPLHLELWENLLGTVETKKKHAHTTTEMDNTHTHTNKHTTTHTHIHTHEHRAINLLETSHFWSVKFFFFYENVITTEETTEKDQNSGIRNAPAHTFVTYNMSKHHHKSATMAVNPRWLSLRGLFKSTSTF
jgi:hypothetical protein